MAKYSVWAIPPEPLYTQLKTVIAELATEYQAPAFEPHLTVVGTIETELDELLSKVEQIIQDLSALELSLGPISFSTTYFQSVFVRVNSTASLLELNLEIKKKLNHPTEVFMPHISLLYGNHSMKIREEIAKKIDLQPANFTIDHLTITPAIFNPQEWQHLAEIPFGKTAALR